MIFMYFEMLIYGFICGARRRGVPPTLPRVVSDFIYVFNPIDIDWLIAFWMSWLYIDKEWA